MIYHKGFHVYFLFSFKDGRYKSVAMKTSRILSEISYSNKHQANGKLKIQQYCLLSLAVDFLKFH